MKTVQWDVKESFVFPEEAGMPSGVETVNVTPMFTVDRTDEAVRLSGIYHIAAHIALDEEKNRTFDVETAILIDDVEIEMGKGYFEYAVPFNIDLPPEAQDPLDVITQNTLCKVDGQGSFAITWDVECSYLEKKEEVATNVEEIVADVQPVVKETKVEEAVANTQSVVKETTVEEAVVDAQPASKETKVDEAVAITSIAVLENTTFSDEDEALSFIAGLDDGFSSTSYHSNDVFVQDKA